MNKSIMMGAAMVCAGFLAGCSNDDEPELIIDPVLTSNGAYVVNAGSMRSNIAGSLSYLNYETNTMSNNVFYEANGQYIGDTFNDGIVWGDKMYLAVDASSVVHVVDKNTLALEKTIKFEGDTKQPRRLAALGDCVYVSLFDGFLAKIDANTLTVTATVEVGPNPEAVVVYNDLLYVAVSDGYNGGGDYAGSCVAVVDPETMNVVKKIDAGKNLTNLVTNGTDLFVLSSGEYEAGTWKQINYGVKKITNDVAGDFLFAATDMAIFGNTLYYVDNGYGAESISYGKYDITKGTTSSWIDGKDVAYPSGLGVDMSTGDAFVLSNSLGESGYPDYSAAGYVARYKDNGDFVGKYNVGIGQVRLFFNYAEK